MRIKKLELKNFRGFEELTIDFPEGESGLAVFVGVNGSGKTSVLDAISKLLISFITGVFEKIEYAFEICLEKQDFRKGISTTQRCEVEGNFNFNEMPISLKYSAIFNGATKFISDSNSILEPQFKSAWELLSSNNWESHPIICHYKTNRYLAAVTQLSKPEGNRSHFIPPALHGAFDGYTDFEVFFKWFKKLEDDENAQIRFTKNADYRERELDVVRDAMPLFLPGFSDFRVQRGEEEGFVAMKNGIEFSINELSSGEKMTLALVADIARRLCLANPKSQNPILGNGIVLIDEIEQHLHPSWQRTIIPNLRRTFPNIQFILTTHSPQVLSTLKKENVFILDNFKLVKDKPHTYGRDSNAILWDIFGVEKRPPESKEEFSKLYRLMDDPEKNQETEALLRDVEEKYGYYDEEVVRARGQFEFLNED